MAKQIKYTDEFRRKAVELYQISSDSASQVARKLGIHEHTMCRWIELYGKDKTTAPQTASDQAFLPKERFVKQEVDAKLSYALEYIHAIKRHVSALELLLLQGVDYNESDFSK